MKEQKSHSLSPQEIHQLLEGRGRGSKTKTILFWDAKSYRKTHASIDGATIDSAEIKVQVQAVCKMRPTVSAVNLA